VHVNVPEEYSRGMKPGETEPDIVLAEFPDQKFPEKIVRTAEAVSQERASRGNHPMDEARERKTQMRVRGYTIMPTTQRIWVMHKTETPVRSFSPPNESSCNSFQRYR